MSESPNEWTFLNLKRVDISSLKYYKGTKVSLWDFYVTHQACILVL